VNKGLWAGVVIATAPLSGQALAAGSADPVQACARLAGMAVPAAAIGLPTSGATVETAALVAADAKDNPNGEYCMVKGWVNPKDPAAPKMQFEVNLPTAWNRKAVQLGGGGYNGSLVTGLGPAGLQPASVANPLKQGYVTLGSDSGHQGGPGFDGRFTLNDEAFHNFGQASVKKVHDVAVAVVKARYGAAPRRFYFVGNSQGGHEALDAAARYPNDYDGVVANYPAYNVTLLHLASWNVGKALYDNGGPGWMNPAKTKLLVGAVYAACDGLDGVKDGVVSNIKACNAAFNIATVKAKLRCPEGKDAGDACLSDAQIGAVEKIVSPYRPGFAIAGMDEFPKWPLLDGAQFAGGSTFGKRAVPTNPPTGDDALLYNAGTATIKYVLTRNPDTDPLTFDPKSVQARVQESGQVMDVTSVDLTPFRKKGGKIIMIHGTIDDFISPHNSIAYYDRHVARQGKAGMDSFLRFYMVPGLSHGFGPFNAKYDGLGAIDAWVESKRAPGVLTAVDGNKDANRSRPMCLYPAWPKYKGAGSENDAANFTCVTE
jgi:feruloyl esterase